MNLDIRSILWRPISITVSEPLFLTAFSLSLSFLGIALDCHQHKEKGMLGTTFCMCSNWWPCWLLQARDKFRGSESHTQAQCFKQSGLFVFRMLTWLDQADTSTTSTELTPQALSVQGSLDIRVPRSTSALKDDTSFVLRESEKHLYSFDWFHGCEDSQFLDFNLLKLTSTTNYLRVIGHHDCHLCASHTTGTSPAPFPVTIAILWQSSLPSLSVLTTAWLSLPGL